MVFPVHYSRLEKLLTLSGNNTKNWGFFLSKIVNGCNYELTISPNFLTNITKEGFFMQKREMETGQHFA